MSTYINHLEKKVSVRHGVDCFWCECRLTMDTFTIDHVLSLWRGGPDIPENRKPCCVRCNGLRAFIQEAVAGKIKRPQAKQVLLADQWMRKYGRRDNTLTDQEKEKYWTWSRRIKHRVRSR